MQKSQNLERLGKKFKAEGGVAGSVDNSLLRVPSGVVISEMGANFPKGMPIESWIEFGRQHREASETMIWVLIDWIRHGMGEYGERYAAAIEETGYSYSYLSNLISVDNRISLRKEKLTYSHHAAIAPLPADVQLKVLDRAAKGRWSVSQVKAEVSKIKTSTDRGQSLETNDEIRKINRSIAYIGRVRSSEIEQMSPSEREIIREKIATLISMADALIED